MKILLFISLALVSFLHADDPTPWWARDNAGPGGAARFANVRLAAKVEATDTSVKLFHEAEGKLVLYWQSTDPDCAKAVLQQLKWAPSVFVRTDDGFYVALAAIASREETKNPDGQEAQVLRGFAVELGTVSDPAAIKNVKSYSGFPKLPPDVDRSRIRIRDVRDR